MEKIRVGILFGGKSAEHEVSLLSAQNVIEALDTEKYEAVLIGIDKQGRWHTSDQTGFLEHPHDPALISFNSEAPLLALAPGNSTNTLVTCSTQQTVRPVDVIFPILHGPLGEDGTVQGLLRLADLPFVGSDVLGSAICMDKDVSKRLLRDAGLPVAKFLVIHANQSEQPTFEKIVSTLGLPCFVKPANMGSSVGVSKVKDEASFQAALAEAFVFDTKVLVEEFVPGQEIENPFQNSLWHSRELALK